MAECALPRRALLEFRTPLGPSSSICPSLGRPLLGCWRFVRHAAALPFLRHAPFCLTYTRRSCSAQRSKIAATARVCCERRPACCIRLRRQESAAVTVQQALRRSNLSSSEFLVTSRSGEMASLQTSFCPQPEARGSRPAGTPLAFLRFHPKIRRLGDSFSAGRVSPSVKRSWKLTENCSGSGPKVLVRLIRLRIVACARAGCMRSLARRSVDS